MLDSTRGEFREFYRIGTMNRGSTLSSTLEKGSRASFVSYNLDDDASSAGSFQGLQGPDAHLEPIASERPPEKRQIRVTERISTEFLQLIEQVLAQHVVEIEDLKAEVEESKRMANHDADPPEQEREVLHFRQTNWSGVEDPEVARVSKASSISRDSRRIRESDKRNTMAAQLMRKQNEAMKTVGAGEIIEILDENQSELEHAITRPPQIDYDAIPGLLSDTPSVLAERYRSLTRWQKMQYWSQSNQYEMVIFAMLYLNVLWMAFELHVTGLWSYEMLNPMSPMTGPEEKTSWMNAIDWGDLFFALFFMVDVCGRVIILNCLFWKVWVNYVDVVVSILALAEVTIVWTVTWPVNPVIFRLLRIGKLARAVRMFTMTSSMSSLQLLVKCLASSRDMLFCSFSILTFVQCVAGVVLSTLCMDFIQDESQDEELRQEVFKYYGTFTRTFLSMFEIMFANWGPPCRVLVENVSEWFSIFFLIYRCVLGFAVLNVVNAVFVQQTMRTAVMDEDLAYKQRQKEIDLYTKKVRTLFQGLDSTGDGAINLEEFSKLVKSDKLAFWMSQLELEYHDLLQLFEFLDNGDGQITLTEFIDGAARLRGGAKAIDVWRMETKLEVLFEEVLDSLRDVNGKRRRSTVQEVLHNSSFKFISSNVHDQAPPALDPMSNAVRRSTVRYEGELDMDVLEQRRSILAYAS